MLFRNPTDQWLTVVMEREAYRVEPQGFASFPSDWAPIFAARGTVLVAIPESAPAPWPAKVEALDLDDSDDAIAARVAEGLGVAVEAVSMTPSAPAPSAPAPSAPATKAAAPPKPKRKR